MAQKENNIIPMIFDEAFYRKMATQKWRQQDYKKAAEYYEKVLELSPKDFDIQQHYAQCLVKLNIGKKAERLFYENIVKDFHVAESFYELSQLNIELNEPNKAFLFGINYVILSEDKDFREMLEKTFEVTLYLGEYDSAKAMFEELLKEDNSDVHALCHYTLLLYNKKETEKYQKYLKILNKVVPLNDDETFKLGIVLSYLKQYRASQNLLYPLYKKGKFVSIQMYNALSFNFYYLGNKDESIEMWNKLTQISEVDVGYAPWVIEESKTVFESRVLPLLLDDNNHYRLYGIFLLHQLNGKEILMTEDIWSILESMNDYEKLYLTYLVQGLTLNKLDFIHRGMQRLYNFKKFKYNTSLFTDWINQAEMIIAENVDLVDVDRYVAAFVYLSYRRSSQPLTKRQLMDDFNVSRYKLNKAIEFILSI